jgi:hypothetical protein
MLETSLQKLRSVTKLFCTWYLSNVFWNLYELIHDDLSNFLKPTTYLKSLVLPGIFADPTTPTWAYIIFAIAGYFVIFWAYKLEAHSPLSIFLALLCLVIVVYMSFNSLKYAYFAAKLVLSVEFILYLIFFIGLSVAVIASKHIAAFVFGMGFTLVALIIVLGFAVIPIWVSTFFLSTTGVELPSRILASHKISNHSVMLLASLAFPALGGGWLFILRLFTDPGKRYEGVNLIYVLFAVAYGLGLGASITFIAQAITLSVAIYFHSTPIVADTIFWIMLIILTLILLGVIVATDVFGADT